MPERQVVDPQSSTDFDLHADLTLQRFDAGQCVQRVAISTDGDGTVRVSSTGQIPRLRLRQLLATKNSFLLIAEKIGQSIIVDHDGQRMAHLRLQSTSGNRWSIHWWSVFQQWVKSNIR